ncbi:rubrerythrin family protein [Desulfovibrio subterraneus]|jgi:rubrerythrin|uniref:Rubrerythrin n=1 Tax=Desulfovibrio subterraneus TaxID=2718620 RepID=A0A7J0BK78_9BACT|nr:rubrerythrin family protein [Desulfovibrio subterraneus]WBF67743.1 rubrerythrin family protein [Desulfovibrio subterraneus]GFM33582.1 rubrerythrin [Desulfovibrio subterraneus]
MSKSIKGSRTEQNLLKSFAGESQARNRYTYFAAIARKEGYVQISHIFEETANHEKEHAKRMFKFLEGGDVEITATYPAGKLGSTLECLKAAADGEHEEFVSLYPEFARIADEEGFYDVAEMYRKICVAEEYHEERYRALIKNIENDQVFHKDSEIVWRCRNCGYNHKGADAPALCPACVHPQAHFEVKATNW